MLESIKMEVYYTCVYVFFYSRITLLRKRVLIHFQSLDLIQRVHVCSFRLFDLRPIQFKAKINLDRSFTLNDTNLISRPKRFSFSLIP